MTLDEKLVKIIPSERQLNFQQTEFYAFVHFTVNTFTGNEWGWGGEDEKIFNPEKLDAEQWVKAIKSAGMRGLILTCKHHDGFCLWPSKYTDHCVKSSPFRGGKGDVVKEVSDACRKYGIKFGVYYSPWDRNSKLYGQGEPYDDYAVNQLTELLTNYGEIFSVWFDGACGEGPNGKVQYYDWDRYYKVIRELQPGACINVCGPDIRWCGNEAGYTRKAEWSVVPESMRDNEKVAAKSQHEDDAEFRTRIGTSEEDLGSRQRLKDEDRLIWYPAEVNTSIRPGWFWHEHENDKVRTLEDLIKVYNGSVGGNGTFLLNIPPNTDGLFCEEDVKRLEEIGEYLRKTYETDLLPDAALTADSEKPGCGIANVLDQSYDSYYMAEKPSCEILCLWDKEVDIGNIVLMENIKLSQRVESYAVDALIDGSFKEIYAGTVIGYKRIIPTDGVKTSQLRIRITDSRCEPTLSFVGVYEKKIGD